MQVGDLVRFKWWKLRGLEQWIGIIFRKTESDGWYVQWNEGTVMGHNGSELEVICK